MAGDANGQALNTQARSTKMVVRLRTQRSCGSTTASSPSSGPVHTSEAEAEVKVDHAFGDVAAPQLSHP
jgi:hypothetical protein